MIDWVLFVNVLHDYIVLPGTAGMAGYSDYWFHLRVSFLHPLPWVGIGLTAAVAALLLTRPWRRRAGDTRRGSGRP